MITVGEIQSDVTDESLAKSLALLAGIRLDDAVERVARLRDPRFAEHLATIAGQLGQHAIISNVEEVDGEIRVSVMPSPLGVHTSDAEAGRKRPPEKEIDEASKLMRASIAKLEVERAFGRRIFTTIPELFRRGIFAPPVFWPAFNQARYDELERQERRAKRHGVQPPKRSQ